MSKRIVYLLALSLASAVAALGAQTTREDDVRRVQNSAEVFQELVNTPDKGIPDKLLQSARCIAIIPGEKKAAFFVGGNYGKGLVTCRDASGWTAPLFLTIGGGSFGFQWGAQSSDLVLIFRNKSGLEKQLSDKFQLGANASAAAGPVGRDAEADTDVSLKAEVLTYSRSKGAFAGISLKGAVLQPDESGNAAFYGNDTTREAVLNGHVAVPHDAAPLVRAIRTATHTETAHVERRTTTKTETKTETETK